MRKPSTLCPYRASLADPKGLQKNNNYCEPCSLRDGRGLAASGGGLRRPSTSRLAHVARTDFCLDRDWCGPSPVGQLQLVEPDTEFSQAVGASGVVSWLKGLRWQRLRRDGLSLIKQSPTATEVRSRLVRCSIIYTGSRSSWSSYVWCSVLRYFVQYRVSRRVQPESVARHFLPL